MAVWRSKLGQGEADETAFKTEKLGACLRSVRQEHQCFTPIVKPERPARKRQQGLSSR
jgi:hypothetical protein